MFNTVNPHYLPLQRFMESVLRKRNRKMSLRRQIENRLPRFLQDLETVVNIDSPSGHAEGLQEVCAFFRDRFENIGYQAVEHYFDNGKVPCLEAVRMPPKREKRHFDFLFLGHMDTVYPVGTVAERPFRSDAQHLHGPGVCDMKGGLVTMLHVAEILAESKLAAETAICMALNSDEEVGSTVSRPWYEALAARSERVLVFEPWRSTGHRILHRKGGGVFKVTCHGKSAHAGAAPGDGANAAVEMAHQILAIQTLRRPELGTSVNVTMVSAGTADNVIPSLAQASVDVRIATNEEKDRIEADFKELIQTAHTDGVRLEVSGGITRDPMVPTPQTLAMWDQVAAIGENIGLEMKLTSTGGCSDGNYTAALGIPTIDAMGIRGGAAHSEDEYADLDSIVPNLHLLCEIVKAVSDGKIS
jgi:glutamate carboxypeptidase